MTVRKWGAMTALSFAVVVALAACGDDDDDNDNGGQSSNSSVSSSANSSNGSNSSASSASSTAGTKACPEKYRSITSSGNGGIFGANISIGSGDGRAVLSVKTPSTSIGSFKICFGIPDSGTLPSTGAGARNYEVLGEGNYKSLLNPTLTITYANAGNVTVDYLAIPGQSGAAYGSYDAAGNLVVDRRVTTSAAVEGPAVVATVTAVTPGLYMTNEQ